MEPYTILAATGRDHLLGYVWGVKNTDGSWWGEGDQVVSIDGRQAMQDTRSEGH